jgi:hypothetical protein
MEINYRRRYVNNFNESVYKLRKPSAKKEIYVHFSSGFPGRYLERLLEDTVMTFFYKSAVK